MKLGQFMSNFKIENFITTPCLLPKLFKLAMYFVLHAWAFDNAMTSEYLSEKLKLDYLSKRAFK